MWRYNPKANYNGELCAQMQEFRFECPNGQAFAAQSRHRVKKLQRYCLIFETIGAQEQEFS
jgi:hypothetical protein